ncbi:hypothetical protein [Deinococcus peraridilitoris]|uniref:hypothetical protein n=1 Tax=Deinococcus peraridilitoris TaxID=432329 RepID=UPI001FE15F86|nr:hypothetical protein [Deinococcus peraridilitoris]
MRDHSTLVRPQVRQPFARRQTIDVGVRAHPQAERHTVLGQERQPVRPDELTVSDQQANLVGLQEFECPAEQLRTDSLVAAPTVVERLPQEWDRNAAPADGKDQQVHILAAEFPVAGRRPHGRLAQNSPQSGLRACARPFCPRTSGRG